MPLHGSRNVLVIDDEPYIRNLIRDILEGDGCHVFEVGNGRQALVSMTSNRFDLIILDLRMPVLNGHDFLGDLRVSGLPIPPVLVLTGEEDEVDRLDVLVCPLVKKVMPKPFEVDELKAAVRGLIAGYKARSQPI